MKKFPIADVYNQEASKLIEARNSVRIIHKTGNVDASGDELEIPFRQMLSRRLPAQYYVGHGHIVDSDLNVSPQFDVIIADSSATPILLDGQNGTQYFPYESVYAIGEIKSSYYKSSKYVKTYISSTQELIENFSRENVTKNYFGNGLYLGRGFSINDAREIRNPLFSFMVFGNRNDYNPDEFKQQLDSSMSIPNPNVICFLDGSIITKSSLVKTLEGYSRGLELDSLRQKEKELSLVELNFTNNDKSGQALAILMVGLMLHLTSTRLHNPPFNKYVNSIFASAAHTEVIIR